MRVVAITRVRDEDDIIEAFVRHTAPLVMHHIFVDDGSVDRTIGILRKLKNEGFPITVYQSKAVTFNESDALTIMYNMACEQFKADWIMCLDVDEFIDDRKLPGGLLTLLRMNLETGPEFDYFQLPMVTYVATSKDNPNEVNVALRMNRRRPPSDSYKIIIRGNLHPRNVSIQHGSHFALIGGEYGKGRIEDNLWLAHYSERSPYQHIVKFVRGWNKVKATGQEEIDKKTAYHYRAPYEVLRDTPEQLLLDRNFMGFKNESPDLVLDPIKYHGGPLSMTLKNYEGMRAVRCLIGYLDQLSQQHGALMDHFPEVRQKVREWESRCDQII